MNYNLQHIVESKRAQRRKMAVESPTKKLQVLDELHIRAQIQKGARRAKSAPRSPAVTDTSAKSIKKFRPKATKLHSSSKAHRFGGRATASGVNYEVSVAAYIAVKMLAGNRCFVWEGINGAEVSAITLQAPEPVDDIVVSLVGDTDARVFISAKKRSASIALTRRNATFRETISAFVRQFLNLSSAGRIKSRLVWAIPSSAKQAAAYDLPEGLDAHRKDSGDDSVQAFLRRRKKGEKHALIGLISEAKRRWKSATGKVPTDPEIRDFLRKVYVEVYDFAPGGQIMREAEGNISSHLVANPSQTKRTWQRLESFFANANQQGIRITPATLRQELTADGILLQSPPEYAEEIARLRELTVRNQSLLKEHTLLRFGPKVVDEIRIDRSNELTAIRAAVKSGHLLLTGEPGSGKSGIIFALTDYLESNGVPVVLLLAEEVFGRSWTGTIGLPGFAHSLDEILSNWPTGRKGVLITDALDAVRDVESQKALRHLLRDVQLGQSGWTVVASVREYDLKHGRELREAFPGIGASGYSKQEFDGVAHFYLPRLTEGQLDQLIALRSDIRPFVDSARKNQRAEGIHHLPFFLQLAAELLRDGVTPARLADWNSPAVLLRRFWERRVGDGEDADYREAALQVICRQMVESRRMTLSTKELPFTKDGRAGVRELRSRGILQAPKLRHGMRLGEEEIRFTHHLLHDYAIARILIPTTEASFCPYVTRETFLPIFYRQSFKFALEELWDSDDTRKVFWNSAVAMEGELKLHSITRIVAPILAARRVETIGDLQPLLGAVTNSNGPDSPGEKALRHLDSGLQDAPPEAVCAGASGWCVFIEELSQLLAGKASLEAPLVRILDRLINLKVATDISQTLALNLTARRLLAFHLAKDVSNGWRYAFHVAINVLCRTYAASPAESEKALLSILTPERLAQVPHDDLFELAHGIAHLAGAGDGIVLRLFEVAFGDQPEPGKWQEQGSLMMSMRFQTSDLWNTVQFSLANYYQAQTGDKAGLVTDLACLVWNGVVSRRENRREKLLPVVGKILFRKIECELFEDYSHIWGRDFEHEENIVLSRFEILLKGWAAANDSVKLTESLDTFARRNRTALMWTVMLEAAAEYPTNLGLMLRETLDEPLFLTHPDYSYASTALLGALHRTGDKAQRETLEKLILNLPENALLRDGEKRHPIPSRIEHAQNRLLGVLEEQNIVSSSLLQLRRERQKVETLPSNNKRERPRVTSHFLSDRESMEHRGISLKDPVNEKLYQLREAIKSFHKSENKKLDIKAVEKNWDLLSQVELAVSEHSATHEAMANELWGYLVGACENIVTHAVWPSASTRWKIIRRILLKAAKDPIPETDGEEKGGEEGTLSWGWPAPRLDAARGLPFLALRMGKADKELCAALRKLSRDGSRPLRFNLADRLAVLEKPAAGLMWELIDTFSKEERVFTVLAAVVGSLNWLWEKTPDRVLQYLRLIGDCAVQAPPKNDIHETLARIYLFQFLRTGRPACEDYIIKLIAECDSERGTEALMPQLHICRDGGWLTPYVNGTPAEEADVIRKRAWGFFEKLLASVQVKLRQHYDTLQELAAKGEQDTERAKETREKRDRLARMVDALAAQVYFASGAFDASSNSKKSGLTPSQLPLFWQDAAPVLSALATERHPHTLDYALQTLQHLLPCAPGKIFLLATQAVQSGVGAGMQFESIAADHVVALVQRSLADYPDLFQNNSAGVASECLIGLLKVLDLFVDAGWPKARQLTHRLEEIYR